MANNTPKNSQETKEQNQRTVSEKLQLAVAATLALMMADLSSPTQLQQQYADKWSEISQSMKEIGSKAVDKMLVWLEKVVDAIGPTPAYAGWNPDELDAMLEEENKKGEEISKKKVQLGEKKVQLGEKNKELNKEIKRIQERNARLQILNDNIPFLSDIVSWKISSQDPKNKAKWKESRKKILKNLDELSPDLQIDVKNNISIADKKMWI